MTESYLEKLRERSNARTRLDALEPCPFDCNNCDRIYQERLEELKRDYEKYA